jgi:hypothetical protein
MLLLLLLLLLLLFAIVAMLHVQTLMLKAQGRRETDGAKWWEGN